MAEYRHFAAPHPEWVDFPNRLPRGTRRSQGMPRERLPIQPQPGLDIEHFDVKVRDGTPITLRSYRQSKNKEIPLPVLFYMHGGGYVFGGLETDDATCRVLAEELDLLVLNVEYRLAPENKFPVGFEDCHDLVRWVASSEAQQQLKADLTKGFILGGTSAGANFTAGISHLAVREQLSPPITGVIFLAGSFCHPDARPKEYIDRILSVDEINDAPGLTQKYGAPPEDKRLSPLLFESHANIAKKAYFAVCGWDPRRDEALLFEQLLGEAGLDTKLDVYKGLPHGFWTTCPDLPVSKEWLAKLMDAMRWMLE